MSILYRLEGHTPVAEPDPSAWSAWLVRAIADGSRRVAEDVVEDLVVVSTVFVGSVQSPPLIGEVPLLFESRVFGGRMDAATRLYRTWDDAASGHAKLLATVIAAERGGRS